MSNYQDYLKQKGYLTVGDLLELLKDKPPQSRVNIQVITLFDGEEAIYFTPLKATQDDQKADDNMCVGQIRH